MNAILARAKRQRDSRSVATAAVAAVTGAPPAATRKRKANSSDDSRRSGGYGGGRDDMGEEDYIPLASETASNTVFDNEHHSERSVRDRSLGVSVARMEQSAVSLHLSSAPDVSSVGRGAIRSALSSVHLDDDGEQENEEEEVEDDNAPAPRSLVPHVRGLGGAVAGPGASTQCAVCREQYQSVFDDNRAAPPSQEASTTTSARGAKAQSAIRELIADRYKLIFQVEASLRGRTHDDNIIDCMLQMHRMMIEEQARVFGWPYTPWTAAMLREHYDPLNEHIFDEVREIKADLRQMRRIVDHIARYCLVPNPASPGQMLIDPRMTLLLGRLSSQKIKLVTQLGKSLRTNQCEVANVLHNALSVLKQQESADGGDRLLTDPNMAVGTIAAGGDAMRSANIADLNGGAYGSYKLSGF